mmetsp:Transcript_21778/g.40656  ORF Transcript_21778/g.40656 Transcript_21778/m.40656 type:complete len:141 (-) Transcript_21778:535-957(-)
MSDSTAMLDTVSLEDTVVEMNVPSDGVTEEEAKKASGEANDGETKTKVKRKNNGKRKSSEADANADNQAKEKKPRVKPEKVQEVVNMIIDEMVKNYKFGLTEVPIDALLKATGYKHPRSDAIMAATKILKNDGIATRTKG